MTLYDHIKNMSLTEMACLLGRITIDSTYNVLLAVGKKGEMMDAETIKSIIQSWEAELGKELETSEDNIR